MQGFNMGRYVPPELEGTTSGNRLHGRRAAGVTRPDGTQTVRFELPYAVWCQHCAPPALIGQGVRFNAEKAKVGRYHTTPIWRFRLRHPACGGTIEIRTDPQHTAYVVTAGGKARDYGEGNERAREGEDGQPILTAEERERRREDAFAALEGKVEEKALVKDQATRIRELYGTRERDWEDPWSVNKRLRDTFRHERKVRKREEEADEALKTRLGTDMELLPATTEDATRAKLISFGADDAPVSVDRSSSKPFLRAQRSSSSVSLRSSKSAKDSRNELLRRQLLSNTRAAMNPFGRRGA